MDKERLLYRHFSNQLSPKEQAIFDDFLKNDQEFKEQYHFEKNLKEAIRDKNLSELKEKLRSFERGAYEKTVPLHAKNRLFAYRKWAMAASVALLVGLGWLCHEIFFGTDYNALYHKNFKDYPNTVFSITRGEAVETLERTAFAAYELGDYRTAADNFLEIPEADKKEYLDFYLGLCYLHLDQLGKARAHFKSTVALDREFKPQALWYLALAALKEKDVNGAKNYLNELTGISDYKKNEALGLLKELE